MAWSIENMESHLYRISLPILLESLMESSLDVLCEVITPISINTGNVFLDLVKICGKLMNAKSGHIINVSVPNEADSYIKVWVV